MPEPYRWILARWIPALIAVVVAAVLGWSAPTAAAAPSLPTPSRWPLDGPVAELRGFEPPAERWARGHRGVDLAAAVGQPVLAAAAGTVTFAGMLAGRGVVVVRHGDVRTTYEPVAAGTTVGSRVLLGQPIGTVQPGGHCTRTCLHWGLLEDTTYLDPTLLGHRSSPVRLLAETAVEEATTRAAARAAARLAAARAAQAAQVAAPAFAVGASGPGGSQFLHPVAGPITSGFGMRRHPVLQVWRLHDGTDFAAPCGSPIVAPAPGRVDAASYPPGYGNRLIIDHGRVDGRAVRTAYNHAQYYVVRPGQSVQRGQLLGYVGSTGYSTGCHLHLMVWLDGGLANPMTWFRP